MTSEGQNRLECLCLAKAVPSLYTPPLFYPQSANGDFPPDIRKLTCLIKARTFPIAPDFVVNRILRINLEDFADWPESVRHLATEIAEELFLVAYNPFVDSATVKASVKERFDREVFALAHHYANTIGEGITLVLERA